MQSAAAIEAYVQALASHWETCHHLDSGAREEERHRRQIDALAQAAGLLERGDPRQDRQKMEAFVGALSKVALKRRLAEETADEGSLHDAADEALARRVAALGLGDA